MSNSSLVSKTIPAYIGNYAKGRNGESISEITIHHCAGNISIETLGTMWQDPKRLASSTYGINGKNVGQYVDESDTAYCNSNFVSNRRTVSIETANSGGDPNWPVSSDSLDTLIKLVADIAKRNNLHPLVCGKTLTWHSMYSATACPGPYLMGRMQYIVDEANKINAASESGGKTLYGVVRQVIALSDKKKAEEYASKLNSLGENDAYYKVIDIPQ